MIFHDGSRQPVISGPEGMRSGKSVSEFEVAEVPKKGVALAGIVAGVLQLFASESFGLVQKSFSQDENEDPL